MGCTVRQIAPNIWLLDFDGAAPGGMGGGSLFVDPLQGLASLTGIHKNVFLPKRSTGSLLADCLRLIGLGQPAILEGYNVREKKTLAALAIGGTGSGTPIGHLLENTIRTLGGTIIRWEPIKDANAFHLRVHVVYP